MRVWRANGISWATIRMYLMWVRRFRDYCQKQGRSPDELLTSPIVERWAVGRARRRKTKLAISRRIAHTALWAWSWGLEACGHPVPPWKPSAIKPSRRPALVNDFVKYRLRVQGVAQSTIRGDVAELANFLQFIRLRRRKIAGIQITDVDDYLSDCCKRLAPKTVGRRACVLRSFLRFLYSSDRIRADLAGSIEGPRMRSNDRPPRALPWRDVRRILRVIPKNSRKGRRDHALLLMMAVYGLCAGEVLGVDLDNIDWRQDRFRVVRAKTKREIILPLLPGVTRALVSYLRLGRPRHPTTRALFVQLHAPYGRLRSPAAIGHILREHASAAGVSAPFLGSHVLRHSHASRQIELGTPATTVGNILGHQRPETTSGYVRVALRLLRCVSLPVPR